MRAGHPSDVALPGNIRVELLADHPTAIPVIVAMRCQEWGRPSDLANWLASTRSEAGHETVPVSWVARDPDGVALGAVALVAYDWDD
jgi:hypothetical protein